MCIRDSTRRPSRASLTLPSPPAADAQVRMIYQTNSNLFRSFLKASTKPTATGGAGPTAKDPKAKGSDGKYQGE